MLQGFKLVHVDGGYSMVEIYTDAAAFETHTANKLACPFADEVAALPTQVTEASGTIYGRRAEVALAYNSPDRYLGLLWCSASVSPS